MEPEPRQPRRPWEEQQQQRRGPTWTELAAQHWVQYAATLLLFVLLEVVDPWEPVPRIIYHKSDAEYWRYSKPMMPDAIPIWVVPCLALALPAIVILGLHLAGRVSRREAHHACLALFACVALTGMLSNLLKSQVAHPRPDFMSRCWPSGGEPAWSPEGAPLCEEGVPHAVLKTGMRSFPSVHAAWTAAGLGFLSLWLVGLMRCFAAGVAAQPAQLVLALSPLMVAGWVGIRRLQIYRHHLEDVLGAQLLGLLLACLFYRQVFASPFSAQAGRLNEEVLGAEGQRQQLVGDSEAESELEPFVP